MIQQTNDYEFFVLVLDDIFTPISNPLKRKKKKKKRQHSGYFTYWFILFFSNPFHFELDNGGILLKQTSARFARIDDGILRRFLFYKSARSCESIEGKCGSPIGFHSMRESAPKKLRSQVAYCSNLATVQFIFLYVYIYILHPCGYDAYVTRDTYREP